LILISLWIFEVDFDVELAGLDFRCKIENPAMICQRATDGTFCRDSDKSQTDGAALHNECDIMHNISRDSYYACKRSLDVR
jgi:hypothetical protein